MSDSRTGYGLDPLSLTQQDIYFDQLHYYGNPKYNIGGYVQLECINISTYKSAFAAVVEQFDMFGTRIVKTENGTFQSVSNQRTTELPVVDFSSEQNPQEAASSQLRSFMAQPFELYDSELFGFKLFKLSDNECWFVIRMHHITTDGAGIINMIRQIGLAYQRLSGQNEADIDDKTPDLNQGWREVLSADQDYLVSEKYQKDKAYWSDAVPVSYQSLLPSVHQHQFEQNDNNSNSVPSERDLLIIPRADYQALEASAKQVGLAIPQFLLSLLYVYFWKVTGEQDLVFGLPAHNRKGYVQKEMLHVFTSVSPLHVAVDGEQTLASLAKQIGAKQKKSYRHQKYPFGHMIRDLELTKTGQKLYDVNYSYLKLDSKLSIGESAAKLFFRSNGYESTPLVVTVWEYGDTQDVEIQFEYNFAHLDAKQASIMMARFEHLLQQAKVAPEQVISAFSLLPEQELAQLENWNDTETRYSSDACLHQLIEQQVAANGDKTAVVFDQQSISWNTLNNNANQLAHFIREQLPQKGEDGNPVFVGLCAERSVEMLTGALAIMKAGAAYLPLDPGYPADRLAYMVEDSGAALILTKGSVETAISAIAETNPNVHCVDIDAQDIQARIAQQPLHNLATSDVSVSADSLVYVIYTSGSTGRPKGVCIEHKALINLLQSMATQPGFNAGQSLLAVTSPGFDIAGLELYLPLLAGGVLHIATKDTVLSSQQLGDYLTDHHIDMMQATPSGWKLLLNNPDWTPKAGFNALCGGEAMPSDLARDLNNRLQPVDGSLWNMYGPTETTIWSSVLPVVNEPILVGGPIANTGFYVLDSADNICGIDCPGELCISGDGLARGYWNRPELTAEKFFHHEGVNQRLYRTGDLVRWTTEGKLAFMGRLDHQVKVRGYRIELGEIESQLSLVNGVKSCAVIAAEKDGEKHLTAFAVIDDDSDQTNFTREAKAQIGRYLAEYMVPEWFVFLDEMPLTPNGKIDRKQLNLPDDIATTQADFVAPETPLQQQVAAIWQQVLQLEQAGIYDNFFHQGGHSILAEQLVSLIRRECQAELPLRVLFEQPTIAAIAEFIASEQPVTAGISTITARADDSSSAPLSFSQRRLWFLDQMEGGSAQYNMFGAFNLTGELDVAGFKRALAKVIARHDVLRTCFVSQQTESDGTQAVEAITHRDIELSVTDLDYSEYELSACQSALTALNQQEISKDFDLTQDMMVRATLVKLPAAHSANYRVLLTMHHIASDGWSVNVFIRELGGCYEAVLAGHEPLLPELSLQYSDVAEWQQGWNDESSKDYALIQQELDWWTAQLADLPQVHSLPLDAVRPEVQTFNGQRFTLALPDSLQQAVRDYANAQGATPFMVMQTAFAWLLQRFSHENDIVIGSPVSGRHQPETHDMIGFFVNTLALRSTFADDAATTDFNTLLQQNKAQLINAFEHQHVPFDLLVDALNPTRSLSHTPIFQIMFAVQTEEISEFSLADCTLVLSDDQPVIAKFDLMLTVIDQPGQFACQWDYCSDIFDAVSIERFAAAYQALLSDVVKEGHKPAGELSLLNDKQLYEITHQPLAPAQSATMTLASRLEQQVAIHQDKPALISNGIELSWNAFNSQVNQLAHTLMAEGVEPGDLVAVSMNRSAAMIIAIFATLKVGAAYVPVSADYPQERIDYMLQDSNASLLLTESAFAEAFSHQGCKTLLLDKLDITQASMANPVVSGFTGEATASQQLAYVIYTSGSTGNPKGVALSHHAVLNFTVDTDCIDLSSARGFMGFSNISFDGSVFDLFLSLMNGKHLLFTTRDELNDIASWPALCERYDINTALVPTAFFNMVFAESADALSHLSQILIGGEAANPAITNQFNETYPTHRLINGYGPTETAVIAVAADISRSDVTFMPIGDALKDKQVFVTDQHQNVLPAGAIGELCIGGNALAEGYLNRDALTSERFLPLNVSLRGGDSFTFRVYRTGDLVRRLANGQLTFVGRTDGQVKVRGHRIELEEIEQQLMKLTAVSRACVRVKTDKQGQQALVGFLTRYTSATMDDPTFIEQISTEISQALPEYMLPDHYVPLAELPLTANGKVDKKQLDKLCASMDVSFSDVTRDIVAPANEVEQEVITLVAEVLGQETTTISMSDSFFDLGGNSLLVVKLVNRLNHAFDTELNVKDIFTYNTPALLADFILSSQMDDETALQDILDDLDGLSEEEVEQMLAELDAE